jgi:glycine reductase complex component B subunit gamma
MTQKYRVIYSLNQFFAGLGGEDKAYQPPQLLEGARGPGLLLEKLFPHIEVAATLVVGDNYLAEKTETALREILTLLTPGFAAEGADKIHLLLAGPAFNAGRYGIACGAICQAVQESFSIPALTAMYPDNPAVAEYRKDVLIAKAGKDVMAMEEAVRSMALLAIKQLNGEELFPDRHNYIPHGRRKNYFAEKTGATRACDMLALKLAGKAFHTEYTMPVFDRVQPAPPIHDMTKAKLALVTSGGIVPRGNPDRIEASSASRFGIYSLRGLLQFSSETHQTAHGGYDPTFANADPNRILPLDAVRELESEGAFASLHDFYYSTVGNGTSVANAENYGLEIAKLLIADGVQAVILTST